MKTWTTVGWLLLLTGGCGRAAVPDAPQQQQPAPARPPLPPPVDYDRPIRICVLDGGRLREVRVEYNSRTGDTIFEGRPFRDRFSDSGQYAASRRWFVDNEPIGLEGRRYSRYGLSRILGVREVRPVGEFDGVLLFADARSPGPHDVLYVPVRSGCEFQPYQWDLVTGGVRGGR